MNIQFPTSNPVISRRSFLETLVGGGAGAALSETALPAERRIKAAVEPTVNTGGSAAKIIQQIDSPIWKLSPITEPEKIDPSWGSLATNPNQNIYIKSDPQISRNKDGEVIGIGAGTVSIIVSDKEGHKELIKIPNPGGCLGFGYDVKINGSKVIIGSLSGADKNGKMNGHAGIVMVLDLSKPKGISGNPYIYQNQVAGTRVSDKNYQNFERAPFDKKGEIMTAASTGFFLDGYIVFQSVYIGMHPMKGVAQGQRGTIFNVGYTAEDDKSDTTSPTFNLNEVNLINHSSLTPATLASPVKVAGRSVLSSVYVPKNIIPSETGTVAIQASQCTGIPYKYVKLSESAEEDERGLVRADIRYYPGDPQRSQSAEEFAFCILGKSKIPFFGIASENASGASRLPKNLIKDPATEAELSSRPYIKLDDYVFVPSTAITIPAHKKGDSEFMFVLYDYDKDVSMLAATGNKLDLKIFKYEIPGHIVSICRLTENALLTATLLKDKETEISRLKLSFIDLKAPEKEDGFEINITDKDGKIIPLALNDSKNLEFSLQGVIQVDPKAGTLTVAFEAFKKTYVTQIPERVKEWAGLVEPIITTKSNLIDEPIFNVKNTNGATAKIELIGLDGDTVRCYFLDEKDARRIHPKTKSEEWRIGINTLAPVSQDLIRRKVEAANKGLDAN